MQKRFYTGGASDDPSHDFHLPVIRKSESAEASEYFPDPGLVDAANVALLLGQPLLLSGEPGSGKTQFAFSLAKELHANAPELFREEPLKFETKSTSVSRDLFYSYDAMSRFRDAQVRQFGNLSSEDAEDYTPLQYMTYNALGEAIVRANDPQNVAHVVPKDFEHSKRERTVVLIDEVDKAPRDFPNDILNEIEHVYFHVTELGNARVSADPTLRPIILLTSNSEKDLPDAFLRRCIYYHIPFPDDETLKTIIATRLETPFDASDEFLDLATRIFRYLRSVECGLQKKPATAELVGWIRALRENYPKGNPLESVTAFTRTLSALVKTSADRPRALAAIEAWYEERDRDLPEEQ